MWSALRTWLSTRRPAGPAAELLAWGRQQGLVAHPMAAGGGWGLVGTVDALPLRIEWGPAPHGEMQGPVLRLRIDAGLPPRLQMLVLSRPLAEHLEREAYARLTALQQTRLDPGLSESMRWLAMYPPLLVPALRPLRAHLRAVAPAAWTMQAWLTPEVLAALEASPQWLPPGRALQMLTLRGRLELRIEAPAPGRDQLEGAWTLARLALQSARSVASTTAREPAPPTPG